MLLNFAEIIRRLGPDAAFRISAALRPTADYLFNTLLPEQLRTSYTAKSGTMTVRATMAGLVGMDSPFPPTSLVEASTFLENTAKIANHVPLSEQALRDLQQLLLLAGQGGASVDAAVEAINFLNKAVLQPHMDTAEYLRGEALVFGAIDWTFGNIRLQVNYGIPAGNLLTNRTGTAAYHSTASEFWNDVRAARRLLRYAVRAFIAHPEQIDGILANTANSLAVTGQEGGSFTVRRYQTIAGNTVFSSDARDTVTLIAYDREGEILDPTNPGQTIKVPFMPKGKILAVGENRDPGYRVGQGSTVDPRDELALGYTHVGPTVEGGGRPGRWSRLFTPEHMPMQLHGQAVTNLMPVIEAPAKIVVLSTDPPV